MAADDTADEAFVAEVVESAEGAVALAGGVDDGEAAGGGFGEEALFEGGGEGFGVAAADESAGGDGGAAGDEAYGFLGGEEFRFVHARVK